MSNTDHINGQIDESKPRTLIDDSKPTIIHTPYITVVNNQQKNSGITILNMGILKRSNTDHINGQIDESKPRTLIDDSKP